VATRRQRIPGITIAAIKDYYYGLYGDSGKYDSDGDHIPESWVFNDFGPWAVRYFIDRIETRSSTPRRVCRAK